jgi:P4 family phage/plasmid primase-like protien
MEGTTNTSPNVHENTVVTEDQGSSKKKKYSNVNEFLYEYRFSKKNDTSGTKQSTHTRIGDDSANIHGGSYHIPDEDYETFMKLYFNSVVKKNKVEHLTEKQLTTDQSPIAVDIDLHFAYDVEERLYEQGHLDDLVDLYLGELKKSFQFEEGSKFNIFLFEKTKVNRVNEKQITKDGIHMIIGLQMSRQGQKILRKKVLAEIENTWTDLPIVNTWNDVLDEGITNGYTNWQLYGSSKPHHEAYALTQVYEITYDPTDGELENNRGNPADFLNVKDFMQLSVRYHSHPSYFYTTAFSDEIARQTAANGDSQGGRRTPPIQHDGLELKSVEMASPSEISRIRNREELNIHVERFLEATSHMRDYPLRELYENVMVLPESYYGTGSYAKWIRVGWALKNTSNKLLIVWIAFSARAPNFDFTTIPDLCIQWETFDIKTAGVSNRSIHFWAMTDNPNGYNDVRKNTIGYYLDQTINSVTANTINNPLKNAKGAGDYDIAVVLHQMYKDEYVCSDIKSSIWWRFKCHRWKQIDSGTYLRKAISNELRDLYRDRTIELQKYLGGLNPDDEKYKHIKARVDTVLKIISRLGTTADKKNIMQESKDLFYDHEFYERLDSNPYLLGCKNGVIDFKEKIFRKGRPEDYLTKCTNVNYLPMTSSRHKNNKQELEVFMSELFPNQDLREYMWNHLSACLIGMPSLNQTFNNYIGNGQNGKSVLTDLMTHVMGTYKASAPCSLITQGRGKIGGLAPEIVAMKGARYVVMQEPESAEVLHEGPMKELVSGVEPITARAPYMTESVTFVPQFALVLCCNNLMAVRTQDHGTWRRFRVVNFESLFTEKPVHDDPARPYQFKVDFNLMSNFPRWSETMLSMLVERAYENQGRVTDCDVVMSASKEYRASEDYLSQFISEKVMVVDGGSIKKAQLSEEFKLWHGVNFGGRCPSPKGLHEYMDRQYGKNRQGIWKNLRLKYNNEEEEEFDADEEMGEEITMNEM